MPRQPQAPIHLHVATADPEVALEALRQVYTSARMGTVAEGSSFLYRQDVQGDADLNLGRLTFRGSIAGRMVLDEVFSVVLPRAGGVDWTIDGRSGTGLGMFLLQPDQEYYGEVDQLLVDSVDIGLATLQLGRCADAGEGAGAARGAAVVRSAPLVHGPRVGQLCPAESRMSW